MAANDELFTASGNLALDLINTGPRPSGPVRDTISSPDGLHAWLQAVGLVDAEGMPRSPSENRILLTEAYRLRDHVTSLVESRTTGTRPPSLALFGVNRVLAASRLSSALIVDEDGGRFVDQERGTELLTVLAPVAKAAGELLVDAHPSRIRQCASPACRRWFVDTSRGGRRRWCSMATCGNRAKAESHRRRHASA